MKAPAAKGNEAEGTRQERGEPLSPSRFPVSLGLCGEVCASGDARPVGSFQGIGLLSVPSCP